MRLKHRPPGGADGLDFLRAGAREGMHLASTYGESDQLRRQIQRR